MNTFIQEIRKNKLIIGWLIFATVATPVIISQLIKFNFGHFTIGDEDAWVSFFGSYIGGIFSMVGVVLTTYLIIKKNKENIDYSMELQDRQVRDREATIFLLNKCEEVSELLEEFSTLLTESISLFIRQSIEQEVVNKLISLIESGGASEIDLNQEAAKHQAQLTELTSKSLSIRPLVIDKLNKAAAKSYFIDGTQEKIHELKELVIIREDKITDAFIQEKSSGLVNEMGKELIDEVSLKLSPLQQRLTAFSKEQLDKIRNI